MISKNSFLASLKENSKRRIWLWLLSALSYLVIFPTAVAMAISRGKRSEEYLIESLGEALGRQALQEQLIKGMEQFFGITNPVMWLVIAAFAVVSAIQGFSYLYSKKKIDFYMGMPVKRSRRFLRNMAEWYFNIFDTVFRRASHCRIDCSGKRCDDSFCFEGSGSGLWNLSLFLFGRVSFNDFGSDAYR